MRSPIISLLLSALLTTAAMGARTTNPNKVPQNAVLLSKVSTLTLYGGKQTSSRRVSPVSQLLCVGPPDICALYAIDVMRCTNEGADYDAENIQWACRASLPEEFKLGSTDVACEGYESSDDPYVLKGSCGVEYRLLLTDKGEARYRSNQQQQQRPIGWNNQPVQGTPKYTVGSSLSSWDTGEKIAGTLFFLIFAIVLGIIVFGLISACLASNNDNTQRRPPRITGNGGGGGGGNDDPPPPYESTPQPKKKSPPRHSSNVPRSSSNRNQTQDGWRPGVWTGAAAGAAAGYMAGRASQSTQTRSPPPPPQMQQQPMYQYDYPQHQPPQPAPPPRRPANPMWPFGGRSSNPPATVASSSSSSSPSYSSVRHESTGFGTTRRR